MLSKLVLNPQTLVILWPDSVEWNYRLTTMPSLCSLYLPSSLLLSMMGLFLLDSSFWELYPSPPQQDLCALALYSVPIPIST